MLSLLFCFFGVSTEKEEAEAKLIYVESLFGPSLQTVTRSQDSSCPEYILQQAVVTSGFLKAKKGDTEWADTKLLVRNSHGLWKWHRLVIGLYF